MKALHPLTDPREGKRDAERSNAPKSPTEPNSSTQGPPMTHSPDQASPLTIALDWYQGLPKRAREGLSLANLHQLSKRFAALLDQGPRSPAVEELNSEGIHEVVAEGDGFWRTCSGCYETSEGHDVGHYPFSRAFNAKLGGGCGDCGGLGVIWDTTDYDAMGRGITALSPSPAPATLPGEGEEYQRRFDYDMLTAIAEQIAETPPARYSARQCKEMVEAVRDATLSAPVLPGEDDEVVGRAKELRHFLNGEAPLSGREFGDRIQTLSGRSLPYWWRKELSRLDDCLALIEHLKAERAGLEETYADAMLKWGQDVQEFGARYQAAEAALVPWQELHKTVAQLIGQDPETWPEHGNAPLAIAAGYALSRNRVSDLAAQIQAAEARLSATQPSEAWKEALRDAYVAGCTDTHNAIQADPSLALMAVEHAEFGEAASDYAAAQIAALPPVDQAVEGMGWQPIEAAPRNDPINRWLLTDGTAIVIGGRSFVCTGGQTENDFWMTQTGSGWDPAFKIRPTHWMPLPAPPALKDTNHG